MRAGPLHGLPHEALVLLCVLHLDPLDLVGAQEFLQFALDGEGGGREDQGDHDVLKHFSFLLLFPWNILSIPYAGQFVNRKIEKSFFEKGVDISARMW